MNHKTSIVIAASIAIAISLAITLSCKKSDWAVKVADDVVTLDQFHQYYYLQNKMLMNLEKNDLDKIAFDPTMENHPTINKKRFMDFLVSRKLLFRKAKADEELDQDKLNAIIELSAMNAAATYYLTERFKDEIVVTDEEANAFYAANQDIFKGVPIDENIIKRIKAQIFMQKLEKKSNEYIMDLMAEGGVNREGFNKYMREENKKRAKIQTTDPNAAQGTENKVTDKTPALPTQK